MPRFLWKDWRVCCKQRTNKEACVAQLKEEANKFRGEKEAHEIRGASVAWLSIPRFMHFQEIHRHLLRVFQWFMPRWGLVTHALIFESWWSDYFESRNRKRYWCIVSFKCSKNVRGDEDTCESPSWTQRYQMKQSNDDQELLQGKLPLPIVYPQLCKRWVRMCFLTHFLLDK